MGWKAWMTAAGLLGTAVGCTGNVANSPGEDGTEDALATPVFSAGFEANETAALSNQFVSIHNVTGTQPGGTPWALVDGSSAHQGSRALFYGGVDVDTSASYAYARVFDGLHIPVGATTRLRYWIRPLELNGEYAGVDLHFTDGSWLRNSAARDSNGCSLHPAAGHCGAAIIGQWTRVSALIGRTLAGKVIDRIEVAYDQPARKGMYLGYIDDLSLANVVDSPPPPSDAGTPPSSDAGTPPAQDAGTPPPSNTVYVTSSGSDSADGSAAHPWRTLQKAADSAPANDTVRIGPGSYAPFKVTRPNLSFAVQSAGSVTVQGAANVRDVILVSANNVTLDGLTVAGCVPNSNPGAFEDNGSSGVRIDDNTSGVTVKNMVVRDSHGTNSEGLPFGCYGVVLHNASNATVSHTEIFHNGYGIWVRYGGSGVKLLNNLIHDNDVIIRNSNADNDDYGAAGIGFDHTTANPGPLADGNTIYANSGPSHDYTRDGGGLEIYQASYVTMTHNVLHDNEGVLETGTGAGGDCVGNVFSGNTASGKTSSASPANVSAGLILRCAHNMQVTGNTLGPVQWWVFDVSGGDTFAGSIQGLTITGNTINQVASNGQSEAVYSLDLKLTGLGITIDQNHLHTTGWIGYDWNHSPLTTLSAWQSTTGFDVHSNLD